MSERRASIVTRIQEAIHSYIALRYAKPRIVVLGKQDWWEAVKWTKERGYWIPDNVVTASYGVHFYPKMICGIRVVYDMDIESCLEVYG